MLTSRHARRLVGATIGGGAVAASLLVGMAPSALDLAGTAAGVSAATSAYLFTHPDANAFFTSLAGTPRDTLRAQVQQYLDANPQTQADLAGIRQPLADLRARCGGDQGSDDGTAS